MHTRIRPTVIAMFVAVLALLLLGVVPSAGAGGHKDNVCHRTGSKSNPYVGIQPSKNAKGHKTHPEKNGNNDKFNEEGWQKGPHQSGGCADGGDPVIPPPPPPVCPNPPCPPGNGDPVIPPDLAGPAPAIPGQPTVTG